jgi:hypothetical protein
MQGVNCCAELQLILALCCPAEGACSGVPATYRQASCGELLGMFDAAPLLPYFPDGLSDYTCHAFPDDDNPRDSFIVALIALAGACMRANTWK